MLLVDDAQVAGTVCRWVCRVWNSILPCLNVLVVFEFDACEKMRSGTGCERFDTKRHCSIQQMCVVLDGVKDKVEYFLTTSGPRFELKLEESKRAYTTQLTAFICFNSLYSNRAAAATTVVSIVEPTASGRREVCRVCPIDLMLAE
jgi:hypothetical protein